MTPLRIMVVEDSEVQRAFAVSLLKNLGQTDILEAGDGQQALDLIIRSDRIPDIILCDLEMPHMDGIELIRRITEHQLSPAVILISGREPILMTTVQHMAEATGISVLGVISKPLTINSLHSAFNKFFTSKHPMSEDGSAQEKNRPIEEIQAGLDGGEFICLFHPKLTLHSPLLKGVEALARWRHDGTLILPKRFIPVLENTPLMELLTFQILDYALTQLRSWQDYGLDITLSVNLSAPTLAGHDLADRLLEATQSKDIDPTRVIFELTESSVIENLALSLGTLARLRIMGFGLSCDDYGTGFSSLQQLSHIPFTELKIDRSLVMGIDQNAALRVIFENAVELARRLNITATAEGIETIEELQVVRQSGCDVAQGFLLGRPMPGEELTQWIRQQLPQLRKAYF